MRQRRLVSFDWALKKFLCSKANFEILEGFLSELLKEEVRILEVLESEGNKKQRHDKHNKMEMRVKNVRGELILIELRCERELDYLQRLIYGTVQTITEHLSEGEPHTNTIKIVSISILYFDLGQGSDYIYQGTTSFRGVHTNDELGLNEGQKALFHRNTVPELFPEYYLIKVKRFDDVARNTLDEWVYFLKNEEIREEFTALGLKKAREQLDIFELTTSEYNAYDWYQENLHYQASMVESTYGLGKLVGKKQGMLLRQLQHRFGDISTKDRETINNADLPTLEEWSLRILEAQSLDDVFGS